MSSPGTVNHGGNPFILTEAECTDNDEDSDEESEKENICDEVDFINDEAVIQGNSLEVFQTIEKKAGEQQLRNLKRKLLLSPSDNIQSRGETSESRAKRGLFRNIENEAVSPASAKHQVITPGGGDACQITQLMRASNLQASMLGQFKNLIGVGFKELCRQFRHDKTTTTSWVAAVFGAREPLYESSCELLKEQCEYLLARRHTSDFYSICLYLFTFKVAKCRQTVKALLKSMLNVDSAYMLCEPPKIQSSVCALYWFKQSLGHGCFIHGTMPAWLANQTVISHKTSADPSKFNFGEMVQWAYDLNFVEEATIAYHYALEAEHDGNAAAWLACSNQAKYVRDCCTMVRFYKHAEMAKLSISEYINRICNQCTMQGTWMDIMRFLKFQNIEPITFVKSLKSWLRGVPKKNCILIVGPPDTGKSTFCNSLIKFLRGKVLTFAMHKSQFWMQPLYDCKAALLDDATDACLGYFDKYMRNMLDGYPVCIDRKHRAPTEIKAPPLLLTSNVDINAVDRYFYLRSRLTVFYFNEKMPLDEQGAPMFQFTDGTWKCFFKRLWARLELSEPEDEEGEDGSSRTLKCFTSCPDATH
ncbi:E1 protein [Rusa timorensis papillomavirus type 2]|uniref:Replication protein E1 n=2 Tax=non-primate mammal papillomaviruses TaxID=333938 RepID=A0A2R2Z1A5_9PAPI|nr:E1 protein [Rusa timorensis papillomavirus type 2]AOS89496.1 E1 protein [Rusa timorensis papillomavirus type 2]